MPCTPVHHRRRPPLLTALAMALVTLALAGCGDNAPDPAPQPRAVAVTSIKASDEAGTITLPGEIRSARESAVGFEVGGRIVSRNVDNGDTVRQGETLFSLDDGDYRRILSCAAAQSDAADTAARTQAADLARNRELLQEGFISPAEYDQHKASADQARAQADVARQQQRTAAAQLGRTTLAAPISGIVTQVTGEVGQVVGAGHRPCRNAPADGRCALVRPARWSGP